MPKAYQADIALVGIGDTHESDLRARGVGTEMLQRSSSIGTSKTVILPVIDQDRRYIHTIGANADHRVADGVAAAYFLRALGEALDDPARQP